MSISTESEWAQTGSSFSPRSRADKVKLLPGGVYQFVQTLTGWYLDRTHNIFEFPFKVYSASDSIIDRVTKYWDANGGTLGVLMNGLRGAGKCLGKGTPVLMANGDIVPVEEIKNGDRLMGPDGIARIVISTNSGNGQLYRIDPVKGDSWICNDVHMLTLVGCGGDVVDISLNNYLGKPNGFKNKYRLFTSPVSSFENENTKLPVDPYFLGVWFGDGEKALYPYSFGVAIRGINISKPDLEIKQLCEEVSSKWGLKIRTTYGGSGCPTYHITGGNNGGATNSLLDAIRVLVGSKVEVPKTYLTASMENRLAFLAGFLDADAELSHNCFTISQKREDYADAIAFVARSVGLRATKTTRKAKAQTGAEAIYFTVTISGNTDIIPTRLERRKAGPRKQRKNALRTGFRATPIGEGEYFGFTLDGDGRFLLGDFTVTHNTMTAQLLANSLIKAKDLPVLVVREPVPLQAIFDAIKQDMMVVFDEFEKTHDAESQQLLLSTIDGMSRSTFNRLIVFTTNNTTIDENFKDRPSRIHYQFEFQRVADEIIEGLIDDGLPEDLKKFRSDIIDFLHSRSICTIDIVKAVIAEVKTFKESPLSFQDLLNISKGEPPAFTVSILDPESNLPVNTISHYFKPDDRHVSLLSGSKHALDDFVTRGQSSQIAYRSYNETTIIHLLEKCEDDNCWLAEIGVPKRLTPYDGFPQLYDGGHSFWMDNKPKTWAFPFTLDSVNRSAAQLKKLNSLFSSACESGSVYGTGTRAIFKISIEPNRDQAPTRWKITGELD